MAQKMSSKNRAYLATKGNAVRSWRSRTRQRYRYRSSRLQRKKSASSKPPRLQVTDGERRKSKAPLAGQAALAGQTASMVAHELGECNGTLMVSSPNIFPAILKAAFPKRRSLDRTQRTLLLSRFGFKSFKKCFHVGCATIFVPGDFKPCSPRRMFCSLECFQTHWRKKLSSHLWNTC